MAAPRAERAERCTAASSTRSALIGVMAGSAQIGMILDGEAPLSVMVEPLRAVVNDRLVELDEAPLDSSARGRWALCRADGKPLQHSQSLIAQDVMDGDLLWLRFLEDTERRTHVAEHISTAVAAGLSKRHRAIDPATAVRVGIGMLSVAVFLAVGLLAAWRYRHDTWLTAASAAAIAVAVFAIAAVMVAWAQTRFDRTAVDVLVFTGSPALAVATASAVPGPVGAPHAAVGFGVLAAGSVMAVRCGGRALATHSVIIMLSLAAMTVGVVQMLAPVNVMTLLGCMFVVGVLGYQSAAPIARWCAGIRLPVFPAADSRWIFEARPELPTVVHNDDGSTVLEGPASVRDVVVRAERARAFLTGLLVSFGALLVVSVTGMCDPGAERRWLPIVLGALTAGFLVLRARSFMDRVQAIIVAATAVIIVALVSVRYAVTLWTPLALAIGVVVLLAVPALGLIAAAVVPNTTYSPLFRKAVEWVEYLCLMPLFPLVLWMMNVYEAIRYR
ncbi:type VII secretion integral membrane protein EccD [Mycolicibacterium vinylchloridicum]|uniref:type VII secretion integral membrane protein EccD n=1 Tax=Mycolicibacterium vinylchloridicum TaxID=2736928 RepID=UPI002D80E630|nr:type VII secretion integral membrane protein EccD [Mycolicibacterium vinylchloridicum]